MNVARELEYYLGYRVDNDLIAEAEEWMLEHPGADLSEWVDDMIEIGAL